jgi:4-hydroxy 2-oxovalerate aldolase
VEGKIMPQILDCTLRDGAYVVNFGFTEMDTLEISRDLVSVGMDYLEIGHGIGLGAQVAGYGVAAASDIGYMRNASGNWGCFAIPGIATPDDLLTLADNGASFVRIGCDVDMLAESKSYIEDARRHGLKTFVNFMKSYLLDAGSLSDLAVVAAEYGAECVYLVDSSGSMLPMQVADYITLLRAKLPVSVKIGFHGHNNLGLGVANALSAVSCGCDIIDVTLCGIGRGGGNVPAEQFLSALKLAGYQMKPNILKVMDVGERRIRHIAKDAYPTQLDIVSGLGKFHSSNMNAVLRISKEKNIDPRRLILRLSRLNKPSITVEDIYDVVYDVPKLINRIDVGHYYGEDV